MSHGQTVPSYSLFLFLFHFVCFLSTSYVFVEEKNCYLPAQFVNGIQSIDMHNLWKKCFCQSWMFYCWGEPRYIGMGSNRQINKHTWARNLFFNTTSANIRHGNSLLCCLSPDVFTSNKALVNLTILFWFSCPGTLVLSACFMHFWIWHWWEGSGEKLNFDGLTDFDL